MSSKAGSGGYLLTQAWLGFILCSCLLESTHAITLPFNNYLQSLVPWQEAKINYLALLLLFRAFVGVLSIHKTQTLQRLHCLYPCHWQLWRSVFTELCKWALLHPEWAHHFITVERIKLCLKVSEQEKQNSTARITQLKGTQNHLCNHLGDEGQITQHLI